MRPGGRLVYCVCSLEPEEGEAQATGFLGRHPEFQLAPMQPGEGGAPGAALRPDGTLRLLPVCRNRLEAWTVSSSPASNAAPEPRSGGVQPPQFTTAT